MVWIVCKDSDNKVFYENSDTREMTWEKPRELIEAEEKHEKEHLEEYRRLANEIDGMKKDLTITDQNIEEAQQKIDKEKSKRIQIEQDVEKLHEQLKLLDTLWKPNGRIEELPAEILVHIFKQMFDLKAINKCYDTNFQWRQIVKELFKNSNCKFALYT